jgi:hypothetical protein
MNTENIYIDKADVRKLLLTGSPDAALLYIYIHSGNAPADAEKQLHFSASRMSCASATLRQLGLWPEERRIPIQSGERPAYSERDVLDAMDHDQSFRMLYGEVQRIMGRTLNTEELKILLSFERYLGLPAEVVSVLVSYCRDKARQRGNLRNPSLRAIEKEAYFWAEQGIDSLEEAAAFIHSQNTKNSRLSHLKNLLQIRGRALTPAEEKYAASWLEMGFDDEAITMAYERTCLNTGGLNWPYMNKILTRWHSAGWKKGDEIRVADRKSVPHGASGALGEAELEAIRKVLQEG